jgi:hypothetical protein
VFQAAKFSRKLSVQTPVEGLNFLCPESAVSSQKISANVTINSGSYPNISVNYGDFHTDEFRVRGNYLELSEYLVSYQSCFAFRRALVLCWSRSPFTWCTDRQFSGWQSLRHAKRTIPNEGYTARLGSVLHDCRSSANAGMILCYHFANMAYYAMYLPVAETWV